MCPLNPTSSGPHLDPTWAPGKEGSPALLSLTVQVVLEGEGPGTLESQPGLAGIFPAMVVVVLLGLLIRPASILTRDPVLLTSGSITSVPCSPSPSK